MQALNKGYSIQEMYIVINPNTYIPTQVRMRQNATWTTINISNFKSKPQNDAVFTFNKRDYPSAEVIDLR